MTALPWRAKQTTTTTGTGTLTLIAAASNMRGFQTAFGAVARRVQYMISGTSFYERGLGDYDGGSPGTLTRSVILESSNAGAAVSLPAGTADVFAVIDPAQRVTVTGTGALTIAAADIGNAVYWTGTSAQTASLVAVANIPEGIGTVFRNGGTANLTLDPNASELINGALTLVLTPGQAVEVFRIGSAWVAYYEGSRMVGEVVVLPASFASPPPRCLWANGQNVSRTTYAALFALYGTTHGAGDGSTTFGIPDLRGRAIFGKDDMGGSAASRLTSAVSGVDGATVGASGGSQLLHQHTHTMTDPGHTHTVTDPGHTHTLTASQQPASTPGSGIAGGGTGYTFNVGTMNSATTGITNVSNTTGITAQNAGTGSSQNVPPAFVSNVFIYAGV